MSSSGIDEVGAGEYVSPPRKEPYAKLVYLLRRKPGLSLEEFQEHWFCRHAAFGRSHPAVLRYVQYHALANDPIREALPQAGDGSDTKSYDGMAVAWFDSVAAMRAAMTSQAVAAALEDERHFIDHNRSVAVLTDEHVVVEPSGDAPIVLVECLRRIAGIDRRTFSERWLGHGAIGREAHSRGLLQGYIQNHAIAEDDARVAEIEELGSTGENWDGVVTAYFHSLAIAKELFADPLASEKSYEDEKTFIDHSQNLYFLARRRPIKDLVR